MNEGGDLRRLGGAYECARKRIVELVASVGEDATSAAVVPACPEWTVRDLIAHMTGVCADVMTGNVQRTPTREWTAAQLVARRERSTADIVAEWEEVGPQIAALIDDFPGAYGAQMVSDVTVHEHDIRGALGRPGARGSDGVAICLDFLVTILLHPCMCALGLGPLDVRADDKGWIVGSGDPAGGDPEAAWTDALLAGPEAPDPAAAPVGALSVGRFELFRALTGRRSAQQIRAFDWTVDPEPYLPIFGLGPFTVRPTDLSE
jgi:uncharacterized protein (TIGR03083 family)